MLSFLSSVLWFLVAIGVLVTVHEFGHFWVARRLGVKVLQFSVGFGRPLLRWQAGPDHTEYRIAVIPLGGYVRMLDANQDEVAESELPRAFDQQSLAVRTAVVSAGPAFNFLFAIVAYWAMFVVGVDGLRPVIEEVAPGSPAEVAGLGPGQEITHVDGQETHTWQGVVERVIGAALRGGVLPLHVRSPEHPDPREAGLPLEGIAVDELTQGRVFERLGIAPPRVRVEAILLSVVEDSPAARAGLAAGDRVLVADGQPIAEWTDFVRHIQERPGTRIPVVVERNGERFTHQVETDAKEGGNGPYGWIGVAVRPPPSEVVDAFYAEHSARERYPPLEALGRALDRTMEMSLLTVRMLWKMVRLEVSASNLSGPISIAQYASVSAERGLPWFLGFLAIVSIGLGILNLLPIPLLDGGHLMYYCAEFLTGRVVSEKARFLGQRLGIGMLVGLMGLAFYNDLVRLFG